MLTQYQNNSFPLLSSQLFQHLEYLFSQPKHQRYPYNEMIAYYFSRIFDTINSQDSELKETRAPSQIYTLFKEMRKPSLSGVKSRSLTGKYVLRRPEKESKLSNL